jgi:REP element-mobilizing transposase RayT
MISITLSGGGSCRDEARRRSEATAQKRSKRRARGAKAKQQAFAFTSTGRGGARKGAGRKPKGARAGIPHRSRAAHVRSDPVQTTTRLKSGLPSLRHAREFAVVRRAIAAASAQPEFRVVHHSIQTNHLHLIVEAEDRGALSMGMRALLVRIARGLNRLWGRRGSIFADRFHARALRTPAEVRNSLVYVLQNARKHGIATGGPDPYSSGPWFDGWRELPGLPEALERQRARIEAGIVEVWGVLTRAERAPRPRRSVQADPTALRPIEPTTWMLRIGWQRKGLLDVRERPVSA